MQIILEVGKSSSAYRDDRSDVDKRPTGTTARTVRNPSPYKPHDNQNSSRRKWYFDAESEISNFRLE